MRFHLSTIAILVLIGFGTIEYVGAESPPSLSLKFGTFGQGNGQFDQPWGIDVDSSGNIYVSEYWNHRIQKFDSSGDYLATIDAKGIYGYDCTNYPTNCDDNGQLNQPMGLDIDNSGNVWVVDLGNQRIQKFNSAGSFQLKFGSQGSGDGQFYSPKDVALDSSGNIWVADTNNDRIQKFDSNGNFLIKFGSTGSGQGQFNNAQSLAFDSSGNIYVVDHNNRRVQKFSSNGGFLLQFGSYGTGNGQFINPHYVAVDSSNNVYVTDREAHNVQKFDSNGNFIWKLGSQGSGDGKFNDPAGIFVDNSGKIYVVDKGNNRVQVFSNPPDTVSPTVTPSANIQVTTTVSSGTTVTYPQPIATDNVGVVSGPTCNPSSGSIFPIGITTVTCTATDAAGNVGSATFTVTVSLQTASPAVTTDKSSYQIGDSVTISGSGFAPTTAVTISIISPSNTIIQELTAFTTSIGSFQMIWVISQNLQEGTYKINTNVDTFSTSNTISISGSQPADYTVDKMYVETSRSKYQQGEFIEFNGQVASPYDPSILVTLRIIGPLVGGQSEQIIAVGQVPLQSNGIFEGKYSSLKIGGDYKIIVNYATQMAEATFYYEGTTESETPQDGEYIETSKSFYERGETIRIYGKVNSLLEKTPIIVQIFFNQDLVEVAQVEVSQDGSFTHTLLGDGLYFQNDGTYTVKATYGPAGSVYETSFQFGIESDTQCGPGTVMRNGVCVLDETQLPEEPEEPEEQPFTDLPFKAAVSIPLGSSSPGCETTNDCFIPNIVAIAVGGDIEWVNSDSAAHTVTSGTLDSGPDGIFDSSLMMSGKTYQHKFEEMGEFPYFCVVHPWMVGIVLVGEGDYVPPQPEPTPIHLDVNTDNSVYDIGNNVRISVTTTGATDSQSVGISITNPSGSVVISRSIQVQNNFGEFEFKIPEDFKAGTYRVDATLSANGQNYKDSTFFKIISQFNQVRIISVDSTDQQGNPAPLKKGEMGFVKVVVSSDKIIAGLVTVNLFDSDLTSIGIGSVKSTFNSGQSELILSFMIPDDIVGDTADIYVNIFTDWPSQGGVPFTSEVSKQVLVN